MSVPALLVSILLAAAIPQSRRSTASEIFAQIKVGERYGCDMIDRVRSPHRLLLPVQVLMPRGKRGPIVLLRPYGVDLPRKTDVCVERPRGVPAAFLVRTINKDGTVIAQVTMMRRDPSKDADSWGTMTEFDYSVELLRQGVARWNTKEAPKDDKLKTAEAEARTAGRGIWKK